MTQEGLAKAIGVNVYSIKMWEGDKFEPNAGNLRALCQTLDVLAEELFGEQKPDLVLSIDKDRVAFIDEVMNMSDNDLNRIMKYYELIKNSQEKDPRK